jgi:hypothetical protein
MRAWGQYYGMTKAAYDGLITQLNAEADDTGAQTSPLKQRMDLDLANGASHVMREFPHRDEIVMLIEHQSNIAESHASEFVKRTIRCEIEAFELK